MAADLADLCIEARWIAACNADLEPLPGHAVVVRDGRVVAVLPRDEARRRYDATVHVELPDHLLIPGLVNSHADTGATLLRAAPRVPAGAPAAEFARDGARLAMAEMIRGGVTCCADAASLPRASAAAALEAGMRVVVGLPVGDFTAALEFRDEYKDHPLLSTAFALADSAALPDEVLSKLSTLAAELDLGLHARLYAGDDDVARSLRLHGRRPLERLRRAGLLTPALHAVNMVRAEAADWELAHEGRIAVSYCLQANLAAGQGLPLIDTATPDARRGLASGAEPEYRGHVLWTEIRLMGLRSGGTEALAMATRGGAAALGLDADIGSIEPGKWADLCALHLGGPQVQGVGEPCALVVLGGGRDLVSDVWVAGRRLLEDARLTRVDLADIATRTAAWRRRLSADRTESPFTPQEIAP
jgi:5-methylthioadenosine/S-adenosylhomocysteine deaminase